MRYFYKIKLNSVVEIKKSTIFINAKNKIRNTEEE